MHFDAVLCRKDSKSHICLSMNINQVTMQLMIIWFSTWQPINLERLKFSGYRLLDANVFIPALLPASNSRAQREILRVGIHSKSGSEIGASST